MLVDYLVLLMVFMSLRDIFLSYLRFYFFMLKDSFTKSILFVFIPFMINFEYNKAVELLFFCITAGISGIKLISVYLRFLGVVIPM